MRPDKTVEEYYQELLALDKQVFALEVDNLHLRSRLAKYESTFRGKEVRVGDHWWSGRTEQVFEHDEDGVIVAVETDKTGRKLLHLYEGGEGFSMYEDGGFV